MMSKTINVFKTENTEDLYAVVPTQTAACVGNITAVKSVNGKIIIDVAGASGCLMKIKGFNSARRVIGAYAIVSAIGNANNTLRVYNLSAVSNSLSIANVICATALTIQEATKFNREAATIAAGGILCISGAGTTVKNLRATLVLDTIPA
jgi:hypothetical protein